MGWTDGERARLAAVFDELVPWASELGAVDYAEQLLGALEHEPPRVWAGLDGWIPLGAWERHAWEQRIGGWRAAYDRVLAGDATEADRRVLYEHACEACYGDPVHGANRDGDGWRRIGFPRPLFPPGPA